MCDDNTLADQEAWLTHRGGLTRRRLTALSAGAAAATLFAAPAHAGDVVEREVDVPTPDGTADGYFVAPTDGRSPGVIVWPDVIGLRTSFRTMARQLAGAGYAVLAVNPYYRSRRAPVVEPGASFADEAVRETLGSLSEQITPETTTRDARAFVRFLDFQPEVDTGKKIGSAGYCMGGSAVMRTAAAVPERVGAGAVFHAGGLARDTDDSPHRLVPTMKAAFLFAIAESDDARRPTEKSVLQQSFADAGLAAEIRVYKGAGHGWCVLDSPVYHKGKAKRAWGQMLDLFAASLG